MHSGPDQPAFPKVVTGTFRLGLVLPVRFGPYSRWHHPNSRPYPSWARDNYVSQVDDRQLFGSARDQDPNTNQTSTEPRPSATSAKPAVNRRSELPPVGCVVSAAVGDVVEVCVVIVWPGGW